MRELGFTGGSLDALMGGVTETAADAGGASGGKPQAGVGGGARKVTLSGPGTGATDRSSSVP